MRKNKLLLWNHFSLSQGMDLSLLEEHADVYAENLLQRNYFCWYLFNFTATSLGLTCTQVAKPWAPGARGTPPLHREFWGRRILALTLHFEPVCFWLSAFIFTGRNKALKTSLHCYWCSVFRTVNKHTLLLGNTGSKVPTAAISKSCLKNYQNNYSIS